MATTCSSARARRALSVSYPCFFGSKSSVDPPLHNSPPAVCLHDGRSVILEQYYPCHHPIRATPFQFFLAKGMSSAIVEPTPVEPPLPAGWSRHYSKTHKAYYYYNQADSSKSWTVPPIPAVAAAPDPQSEDGEPPRKKRSTKPKVAILVPFRDLHEEQHRQQHLDKFVPHMTSFLAASGNPFALYVIEQSDDGRKFNRGKLLNIGFEVASKEGCEIFVLHDVDLLPSAELRPAYSTLPAQPVHIARVWERYSDNPKYFGGIVAFSGDGYRKINGYPNNFWGWGGEDDEMFNRITKVR